MKYEQIENDTYNLYTIETNKFKSIHLEVIFSIKATKENITYSSMLSSILMENSKEYPTRKMKERKLSDLYNASVFATNSRVGSQIITNFVLEIVDPKYTSPNMLDESIKFLFEMITNPLVSEGSFDEDTFNKVKQRVEIDIDALKEDAKQSSILKSFSYLNKDDVRSFNANGDAHILKDMTPKKLYKFYLDYLENARKDIYAIGNFETKTIDKIIKKYCPFKSIVESDMDIYLKPYKLNKSKTVKENSNFTQTNLVEIYSLKDLSYDEINYVMPLFNMLFGSGSLESKLYKSLRGENSLCYNVSSFYQKYDSVLIVHTALDNDSVALSIKLIKNALTEMIKGEFSIEEVENVKNMMIQSLNMSLDNPGRLIDLYFFQNILCLPPLEERIDKIKEVTKEDIIRACKKINLIMTFRLGGVSR